MPSLDFGLKFSKGNARPRDPEGALRILILGGFGGPDSAAPRVPLESRPIRKLDIDDLGAVLAKTAPRAKVLVAGRSVTIEIDELDDFHPDRLYERLEVFGELRDLRRRLADPAEFAAAAQELGPVPQAPESESPADEADTAMFARLLGADRDLEAPRERERLGSWIADVVGPYIEPRPDPRQDECLAAVDLAISELMRMILRAPSFRSLEAIWRSVAWLIGRLDLGEHAELGLLDVSKAELAEDLDRNSIDLRAARIYHRLIDEVPGAKAWSVLVGCYEFGCEEPDLQLLARMGAVASQVGAPFLAGASSEIVGCEAFAASPDARDWKTPDDVASRNWKALRRSPFARWLGLSAPRLLLRLPYGPRGESIERFAFDELRTVGEHDGYLWGNPAFGIALLLGLAFQEKGWSLEPGEVLDIESLPAHSYERDGDMVLQPCAEAFITERSAQTLLEHGLIPLMSYRDRDCVRVARIQSLASPARALTGPWTPKAEREAP